MLVNKKNLHGYTVQIEKYASAERTQQKIYVFVDIGNPIRLKTITEKHNARVASGEDVPMLVIFYSTQKKAEALVDRLQQRIIKG